MHENKKTLSLAASLLCSLFEFLWTITNSYLRKPEIAAEGCYTLLYQFPLYNTIFMPLTLAAMASRLCDAENKGNTYKLLCTMQQKKLYLTPSFLWVFFMCSFLLRWKPV